MELNWTLPTQKRNPQSNFQYLKNSYRFLVHKNIFLSYWNPWPKIYIKYIQNNKTWHIYEPKTIYITTLVIILTWLVGASWRYRCGRKCDISHSEQKNESFSIIFIITRTSPWSWLFPQQFKKRQKSNKSLRHYVFFIL